jgi:hypothetical protein
MKLRHVIVAAALGSCFGFASAANQTLDLSGGSASFVGSANLLDGGDDIISFVNLAEGSYDFLLTISSQYIADLGATINGMAADVVGSGTVRFASLAASDDSPFVLSVFGTASPLSKYSGELTVTAAVPEPETYALMLIGLGAVGWMARRRRSPR